MINNNGFIGDWIKENSRVLDLGCGDGSLLETLSNKNQVRGYGLEIDPDSISQCIGRGVNVIEQDLNEGLENFADASFGHWRTRADLVFSGRMPVTKRLSYQWYDTPNIHFFTYKDFEALCVERNINIVNRNFVGGRASDLGLDSIWPNLFAHTAVYRLSK
jgi:predicted RNA methylase